MDMLENEKVVMKDGHQILATKYLKNAKIVIYYFSASWVENTRDLVDKLKTLYDENLKRNTKMEIIYVSADTEESHFQKDLSKQGPWAAIPFKNNAADILRWRVRYHMLATDSCCEERRVHHIEERKRRTGEAGYQRYCNLE
nr:unnamed protein product [Callosobruchus analis]